ncbi:MAG: hypothetical protein WD738_22195 [Pirellulales bacterium]
MSVACKRIWEGTLGIAIKPQKKHNGEYFWSFSFVRAFRRTRESNWEYVQHYGQQHAKALGVLMSKAFQFMEQNDPGQFIAKAMAEATDAPPRKEQDAEAMMKVVKLPPPVQAAA